MRPSADVEFVVSAPTEGLLRLLRHDRIVSETRGDELAYRTSAPGVYRVEAEFRGKPWIFSNPITLLSATA